MTIGVDVVKAGKYRIDRGDADDPCAIVFERFARKVA